MSRANFYYRNNLYDYPDIRNLADRMHDALYYPGTLLIGELFTMFRVL
jgi:hypothetical protein